MSTTGGNKGKSRGTKKSTILTEPRRFELAKMKAKEDIMLTFHFNDYFGATIDEINIPQSHFFAETNTRLAEVLDFDEGDIIEHDFRALLGVGRRTNIVPHWEAFRCFQSWLDNGIYKNSQLEGTHIDAYLLSKTIGSPRFGNAIMEVILATMQTRKFDTELTDDFRRIYEHGEAFCPLRALYFETAVFWTLAYGRGDRRYQGMAFHGDGILGLDSVEDDVLIEVMEKHRKEFCPCVAKEYGAHKVAAAMKETGSLGDQSADEKCICNIAPWLRDRERFFTAS
ncbi:hypothetical protein BKA65DRAFT_534817 [Rhexocercosporidium sp. MPI-PUGE-AT-0058]|nr:hypothetical protein BKA65DRAFT_534817 [Rhexocercosporidium sp. MPI-PUGE-AT-0058]